MRKWYIGFLAVLFILLFVGCQEPSAVNSYITNINIAWKGAFSVAPLNPEVGWAYYNTAKKMSFVWDGEVWQIIAQDGKSIEWKGELSAAPSYPEENWAYFNVVDGNSYIYDGESWNYLAKSGRDAESGILLWLGTFDVAPDSPSEGNCYYNSVDRCSYVWDGNSWNILAKDGTDGVPGTSIIWKGVLSTAPSSPELNWAYYDSTTKISYIYNGASWDILAESISGDTIVQVPVNWCGTSDTAPLTPSVGDAYYNSTLKASYIYDGTVWQQISKDGTSIGTGYLITWKGSFESNPSSPEKGWAYYNSTEGKSYIWDGSSWQIMSQDSKNSSSSSGFAEDVTIYLGESQETISEVTYDVKSYAVGTGPVSYFYTYYKYYYLNDKLRRIYVFYHGEGSDLDYLYTDFVEHTCGGGSKTIYIYTYYENGKLESRTTEYKGYDIDSKAVYAYSEAGVRSSIISYTNGQISYDYQYWPSGEPKSYKYYQSSGGVNYLSSERNYYESGNLKEGISYYSDGKVDRIEEYYDTSDSVEKREVLYRTDGSIERECSYYENGNRRKEIYYNMDGSRYEYTYYENGNNKKCVIHYNSSGFPSGETWYNEDETELLSVGYESDGSTISDYKYYYASGYLKYYYTDSGYLYTYNDNKTKTCSTVSSVYLSKEAYTDVQAKTLLESLRPAD